MVWPTHIRPFRGGLAGATWVRVVSIRRYDQQSHEEGDIENLQEITELFHASFTNPESPQSIVLYVWYKMGYSSPIPPTSLASLSHRQLSTEHLYRFFNFDSLMTIFSHTCKLNPSCSLGWSRMIFHQNTIKTTVCLLKNSHHHPFLPAWKSSAFFQSYTTNKTSTNSYSSNPSSPWVDQVEVTPPLPLPSEETPMAPSNNGENHQTTHGTIENYHGYPRNDGPWKRVSLLVLLMVQKSA